MNKRGYVKCSLCRLEKIQGKSGTGLQKFSIFFFKAWSEADNFILFASDKSTGVAA
jgi:hypothetical protein